MSEALRISEQVPDVNDAAPQLATRTHLLPDLGMLHGRMLVAAWENSLEDVHFRALDLLRHAVQVRRVQSLNHFAFKQSIMCKVKHVLYCFHLQAQLKNVVSAVLSRRQGYKLREKRFKFAMGVHDVPAQLRVGALDCDDCERFVTAILAAVYPALTS